MLDRLKAWWEPISRTRAWRAWERFNAAQGSLLAGGITYFAFFSIFPTIALAFTIFGLVLQGHPEFLDAITTAINSQLPGFIKTASNPEGIIAITAPKGSTLSVTAVLGLAGLLWAGLGWLSSLRTGIRAVFGVREDDGNPVTNVVRDVGVLATLGVGIATSALVGSAANAAAGWIAGRIGLDGVVVITGVGIVVQLLVNTALVAAMLRLLSGVSLPWPALRTGAILGGIGLTLLQIFATRLIASAMSNPLLASIGLVVGLLVYLNYVSRIVLLAAAWTANEAGLPQECADAPDAPEAPDEELAES